MKSRSKLAALAVSLSIIATSGVAAAEERSPLVKQIKDRGELLCPAHNGNNMGFMEVDSAGNWKGLDIEICTAVAVAILGSSDKVKFVPMSWSQRWPSLNSGEVDLIVKTTDATMTRDTELGYQFSVPYLFGAFQFLAHKGPTVAVDLAGGSICTSAGSNNVRYLTDFLTVKNIKAEILTYEKREEQRAAYSQGRCDANMGWGPSLAVARTEQSNPDDHVVLPDVINVAPEVIVMRQGDDGFADVVNWTIQALLIAEDQGVTSANVDQMRKDPPNPVVSRLLGATEGIGARLGLSDDWGYNVIKQVGNYEEIYERNFGNDSPYKLERGMNALWKDGGVLVPMLLD